MRTTHSASASVSLPSSLDAPVRSGDERAEAFELGERVEFSINAAVATVVETETLAAAAERAATTLDARPPPPRPPPPPPPPPAPPSPQRLPRRQPPKRQPLTTWIDSIVSACDDAVGSRLSGALLQADAAAVATLRKKEEERASERNYERYQQRFCPSSPYVSEGTAAASAAADASSDEGSDDDE